MNREAVGEIESRANSPIVILNWLRKVAYQLLVDLIAARVPYFRSIWRILSQEVPDLVRATRMNKYGSCIRAAKKKFQNATGFVYFVLIANGWVYDTRSCWSMEARGGNNVHLSNISEVGGCEGDHMYDINNNMGTIGYIRWPMHKAHLSLLPYRPLHLPNLYLLPVDRELHPIAPQVLPDRAKLRYRHQNSLPCHRQPNIPHLLRPRQQDVLYYPRRLP
ncbi:hypothetical protein B9Z19DRAFT_495953 [Tuber borchii]|uniref:Uncharacterized protein n=1 Tax=Tuber borchii TaxID=42251 RepID=A0A2T6ZEL4_TUBBO|nr:hypothetical protein B9Z19DRAFT_495953 [Tuber borchii]